MTDLRYALRLLRKSPLFTLTVVLTVALGIGAHTAIFSVVNAVLLRPLPFSEPDRLMQVAEKNDKLNLPTFGASVLNYLSWKEQTRTFDQLGAIQFATFTLSGQGDPETVHRQRDQPVADAAARPAAGRRPRVHATATTKPGARAGRDDQRGALAAALRRRPGGRRAASDAERRRLHRRRHRAAGADACLTTGDVWMPLVIDPPKEMRLNHVLFVVGRLKPGVTYRAAQAEMDSIAARVGQQYPEVKDWGINLITFTDTFVSAQLRTALLVLLGAVAVRAADRQRERRESAARARAGAAEGDGGARGARREPRPAAPAAARREPRALARSAASAGCWRRCGASAFLESTLPPNLLPVPDIGVDRDRRAVRGWRHAGDRPRLRPGAGVAGGAKRRQHHAEGCRAVVARRRAAAGCGRASPARSWRWRRCS